MTDNYVGQQEVSHISQPNKREKFNNRQQINTEREDDIVVEEHYDQQQERGFSMRR